MPMKPEDVAAMRHWLRSRRARGADDPERADALVRLARANLDSARRIEAVDHLLNLHDRRIKELEAIVELLASQLDVGEDNAGDVTGDPFRGPGAAAPPGTFVCRACGRITPNEEACTSGDGRYCIDCFDPER